MTRKLKQAVEKICLKCKTVFITDKPRQFCSPKCSQSRKWTPQQKQAKSIAKRKAIMADTDEAEEERLRVLKNKRIPPNIPHPDEGLQPGQFSDGVELWTEVEDREWLEGM